MNKKIFITLFLTFTSTFSFAYTLTGEGHVSEPVIVKKDPSFKVIEDTGHITADPEKKSPILLVPKLQSRTSVEK